MSQNIQMDLADQIKKNNAIFKLLVKYMRFALWMLFGFSMGAFILFTALALQEKTIPQESYFYYLMNLPSLGLLFTFGLMNLTASVGKKRNLKLLTQSPEYHECESTMFIINTRLRHVNINIVAYSCLIASVVCLTEFLFKHGMEEASLVSFMTEPSIILCVVLVSAFAILFFIHAIMNSSLDNAILDIQIEMLKEQYEKNKNINL